MTPPAAVAGVVLCGGRSSRMGRTKAWLPFPDRPLLVHVCELVARFAAPVVAVAAPGQPLPPLPPDIEVVYDAAEGEGPLRGLATGLAALAGRAAAAVVVGCDTPFLTPDVIARLVALRGDALACVPVADGFPCPLPGVYAVGVLAVAAGLLAAGRLRLGGLLELVPTRFVTAAELADIDPDARALWNVNTPADYARALAALDTRPAGDSS